MKITMSFVALVCAMALMLSGCSLLPSALNATMLVDGNKYLAEYENLLQYKQLCAAEKPYYGIVYTSIRDQLDADTMIQDENGGSLPGLRISLGNAQLTTAQISHLFEAVYLDNPNFFFIDRTYSLEGQVINDTQVYDTLILRYTMDAAHRTAAAQALEDAVQNILQNCPDTDDDFLIELYLHDALLSHCTYDEVATESATQYPNAYSAYGALVEGKAVCEGYAKAMQWLLTSMAIPATVIRGYSTANQTAHMWDLVEINGAQYFLDPTWDDNDDHLEYAYFNMSATDLERTHTIDASTKITTNCTADKDNYFVRNNTFITVYDRDAIADIIADQIQQGNTAVHLHFADGKFENGLLLLKNQTLTKKMVNARLSGGVKMWNYEIQTIAPQNTLSIYKTN